MVLRSIFFIIIIIYTITRSLSPKLLCIRGPDCYSVYGLKLAELVLSQLAIASLRTTVAGLQLKSMFYTNILTNQIVRLTLCISAE